MKRAEGRGGHKLAASGKPVKRGKGHQHRRRMKEKEVGHE